MLVEEEPIFSIICIPSKKEDAGIWVLCIHLEKVELTENKCYQNFWAYFNLAS